jgi:hypothetical protein
MHAVTFPFSALNFGASENQNSSSLARFHVLFFCVALLYFAIGAPSVALAKQSAPAPAPAEEPKSEYAGGESVMNGYTLKQFGDFVHRWHFVTTRYRRDSGEMRYVYANDIAWKALTSHSQDYPDGAMFAKVGVATADDPAFTDSAVPIRADRVQIMVRNHARHRQTDGWGYAMFNMKGRTFPGKPLAEVSQACHACHLLVPERGLVFSQPMPEISPASAASGVAFTFGEWVPPRAPFITVNVSSLPADIRAHLPEGAVTARQMQGPIPEHVFQGSMHESIPFVGAEAAQSGMPAVLISKQDSKMFSAIWPVKEKGTCTLPGGEAGRKVEGVFYSVLPASITADGVASGQMSYMRISPFCAPAAIALP